MQIDGREIEPGRPPYIIAEMSCNHAGSLYRALKLIEAAKECGADAIKMQCYEAETITLDCESPDFVLSGGPWHGRHLFDLYRETQTPFEWFPKLFEYARNIGITPISSVFDPTAVDLLEALDCPAYKIASFEITDISLIKYAAKTGKPMIISTGMASEEEIQDAARALEGKEAVFLACVSGYPTPPEEMDLSELNADLICGVSDHTEGWEIPVIATVMGAQIIEKHLMLEPGIYSRMPEDADFSMGPAEFQHMVTKVHETWQIVHGPKTEPKSQETSRQARRSLYVVADIKAGEIFCERNVRSIRPAYGLEPKHLFAVLGKKATQDIKAGTALAWEMME